jgi:hypothetical protein
MNNYVYCRSCKIPYYYDHQTNKNYIVSKIVFPENVKMLSFPIGYCSNCNKYISVGREKGITIENKMYGKI